MPLSVRTCVGVWLVTFAAHLPAAEPKAGEFFDEHPLDKQTD